jgi:hypothetical protein
VWFATAVELVLATLKGDKSRMHGSQSMVSTNQGFINPQLISSVHPESPMMIHVKLHMLADL